jgi:hypothetical protein
MDEKTGARQGVEGEKNDFVFFEFGSDAQG